MGIIYLYLSPSGKGYIGQTKKTLSQRWAQHVYEAKNLTGGCVLLNKAILKYGPEKFQKTIVMECLDEELDISEYNTLTPNGYNILTGGNSNKEYTLELKQKMSNSLRKNKEDHDLPMYMSRIIRNDKITFRIKNHPLCSNKIFYDKQEALNFMQKLESGEIEPIIKGPPRKKKNLPKYIMRHTKGYVIEINGKYIKSFVNPKYSNEEKLQMAINHLNKLNINFTNQ